MDHSSCIASIGMAGTGMVTLRDFDDTAHDAHVGEYSDVRCLTSGTPDARIRQHLLSKPLLSNGEIYYVLSLTKVPIAALLRFVPTRTCVRGSSPHLHPCSNLVARDS